VYALLTVHVLEDVQDGEDLSVVRDQRLTHHLCWNNQVLQNLQCGADDLPAPRVEGICRQTQIDVETDRVSKKQKHIEVMSIFTMCDIFLPFVITLTGVLYLHFFALRLCPKHDKCFLHWL